jgi:serine/threonine protein kinase
MNMPISRSQLKAMISSRKLQPIDADNRFFHLAPGFWVYDELLSGLKQSGWVRFAPGFKSGLYGHAECDYCIKVLGMGVGDDPLYFCERGYYLEHERKMLQDFRDHCFDFAPQPLSSEDSIRLLVDKCKISSEQAELRVKRNDVLVMELIVGIPFATQTGCFLNYDINIVGFEEDILQDILAALYTLKVDLETANQQQLLHNDPMPPNIIFTYGDGDRIRARLVDFELAQNLQKPSPDYVNNSIAELYRERDVPNNLQTNKYTMNLDQHLMDKSIGVAEVILRTAPQIRKLADGLDCIDISIPFLGGISINLGQAYKFARRRLENW